MADDTTKSDGPDESSGPRAADKVTQQEARRRARVARAAKRKKKPEHKPASDATIRGGKYISATGDLINAHGKRINEDGSLAEPDDDELDEEIEGTGGVDTANV